MLCKPPDSDTGPCLLADAYRDLPEAEHEYNLGLLCCLPKKPSGHTSDVASFHAQERAGAYFSTNFYPFFATVFLLVFLTCFFFPGSFDRRVANVFVDSSRQSRDANKEYEFSKPSGTTLSPRLEFYISETRFRKASYRYKNACSQPATGQIGAGVFRGFLERLRRSGEMAAGAVGESSGGAKNWRGGRIAHWRESDSVLRVFLEGGSDSALEGGLDSALG